MIGWRLYMIVCNRVVYSYDMSFVIIFKIIS